MSSVLIRILLCCTEKIRIRTQRKQERINEDVLEDSYKNFKTQPAASLIRETND